MTNKGTYTREGQRGGYTVRESKKGWIIEGWSQVQGEPTDYKYLLPYGLYDYEKGQDLYAGHHGYFSVGALLFDMRKSGRCLKRGWTID